MLTIETREIDYIQVIGVSKNRLLIVKQINSNTPVVIKSEETMVEIDPNQFDSRNNVGAMLQFHGTVFSKLRSLPFDTERLTLNEINALRSCIPQKVRGMNPNETWPTVLDSEVLNQHGRKKSVVKISYIEELANLKGMSQHLNQISVLRNCLERGDTSFIFELGQILAVDFFIGNHDRFAPNGLMRGPQNIFFQVKNNTIQATGIDTYDTNNEWSNLNKTIEQLENNTTKWPGRMLSHGAFKERERIANTAVDDILKMAYEGLSGKEVDPKPCPIGPKRKKLLVTQFHKGMSEAKSILRKKYNLGDNLSELTSGIRSRWDIIRK